MWADLGHEGIQSPIKHLHMDSSWLLWALQDTPGMREGIERVVTEATPAKRWAEPIEIGEVIASLSLHLSPSPACTLMSHSMQGTCSTHRRKSSPKLAAWGVPHWDRGIFMSLEECGRAFLLTNLPVCCPKRYQFDSGIDICRWLHSCVQTRQNF